MVAFKVDPSVAFPAAPPAMWISAPPVERQEVSAAVPLVTAPNVAEEQILVPSWKRIAPSVFEALDHTTMLAPLLRKSVPPE